MLKTALHGSEADWTKLGELCAVRSRAEALGRMLEQHTHAGIDAAEAWAHVLADLHPGLKVNLRPTPA